MWIFTRNGSNQDSSKLETMDQVGLYSRNSNDQGEFSLTDVANHLSHNGGGFMHNENGDAVRFVAPTPK